MYIYIYTLEIIARASRALDSPWPMTLAQPSPYPVHMFTHVMFHVTRKRPPYLGKKKSRKNALPMPKMAAPKITPAKGTDNRALKFHSCTYVVCVYSENTIKCA